MWRYLWNIHSIILTLTRIIGLHTIQRQIFTIICIIFLKIIYGVSTDPWSSPYHFQQLLTSSSPLDSSMKDINAEQLSSFKKAMLYVRQGDKFFPSFHVHLGLGYTYDAMARDILQKLKLLKNWFDFQPVSAHKLWKTVSVFNCVYI